MPAPTELQELSVHVELELVRGGVADAHRSRAAVAFQEVQFLLRQAALAAETVHELEALGATGGATLDKAPEVVGAAATAPVRSFMGAFITRADRKTPGL